MPRLSIIFFSVAVGNLFPGSIQATDTRPVTWTENYKEARALAQESRLPLILWFTGSDWCGWCNKLEVGLFADERFREATGEEFIAVKLDFPRRTRPPLAIERQNRLLQRQFAVETFPTVIWLCPQTGAELNRHSYLQVSTERYLAALRHASKTCLDIP